MKFELTTIDPHTCSIEELEREITRLKDLSNEYDGLQGSIKVFLNSIYGACASPYFVGYNTNIAEAVTLQGQDLIKYANKVLDDYFLNKWHIDTELHKKLGLTYVNKIKELSISIYNDTDSLIGSSVITYINKHGDVLSSTTEEFYDNNKHNGSAGVTLNGHDSVKTDDRVLNWKEDTGFYYARIKRIIRHRVSKPKWILKIKNGNEVTVTCDHSLVVFRNGEKVIVKPQQVKPYEDEIVYLNDKTPDKCFDLVDSCERIGMFQNEYVYDIEVDDDSHTFIANNILVHNSTYITFDPLLKSCDSPKEKKDIIDLIMNVKEHRLNGYLSGRFDEYAKTFNTNNIQVLEFEKISYSALMIAKKKYILDLAWKDPGVFFEPQTKVISVGVEIVQGSTPKFARKILKELLNLILSKGKSIEYSEIVKRMKQYKEQFVLQNPEDISKTVAIGDYEKYVLADRNKIQLGDKCPINVRAGAIYNNILFNTKWKSKYNLIKTGDKIKHYYAIGNSDVFGFLPGDFPYEFAPPVNYDLQFEKVIVEPFNRFIEPLGFNPIPPNLLYCKTLF